MFVSDFILSVTEEGNILNILCLLLCLHIQQYNLEGKLGGIQECLTIVVSVAIVSDLSSALRVWLIMCRNDVIGV